MIPFFVAILIQLGLLLTPEEWLTLNAAEQQRLENIVITDVPVH